MFIPKLLMATIGFVGPFTLSTAVMADDPWNHDDWNDDDDDWDDDDWDDDDEHDWGDDHGGWHNDGWHDGGKQLRLRNLRFIDKGVRLVVFGELERLKKKGKHAKILVKARGDAEAVCINPGGDIPPGKNPVDADEVTTFGREWLDLSHLHGGSLGFKVATDKPDLRVDGAPDCPNWKWTERIFDVAFTEVELTIVQDGKKLLELECFFDDSTEDGKIHGKQLDCNKR